MIATLLLPVILCQLPAGTDPKIDRSQIVARVGSQTITLAEIDLQLGRSANTDGPLKELPASTKLATIHLIALQRQSLETLKRAKATVSAAEIDKWLEETYATGEELTGASIVRSKARAAGVTEASFRELILWRLSWQKYLNQHLTLANLKKHFQNQPERFDGTRFSIEYLFVPTLPGETDLRTTARDQLTQLRSQLTSGELTFQQAAKQLENHKGTDSKIDPIWISGNGPLHPAVVGEVVKLNASEFSPVFDSPAGVHLVRLLAKEPGARKLEEVTDDVRRHMLLYLLDYSANQSAAQLPLSVIPPESQR